MSASVAAATVIGCANALLVMELKAEPRKHEHDTKEGTTHVTMAHVGSRVVNDRVAVNMAV